MLNQPPTPVLIQDLGMMFATKTSKNKARHGIFKCQCGNEFKAQTQRVKHGHTKSCGCYRLQINTAINITHGLTYHPIYKVWVNMIDRTSSPKVKCFNRYGGRGISVCDRWKDVSLFIEDMYPSYKSGLSIDRIDPNGDYEPNNCRWATKSIQARNTSRLKSNNTSGYRGVGWNKSSNKWISKISINGKTKFIGYFATSLEAAIAYDTFVIENNLEHTTNGLL